MDYYNLDELYHHGTKGMKWGVRRYQNKDGSLTDAGRKRYGSLTEAVGAVKAAHIKAKRKKQLAKAREAAAEKKAAAAQREKDIASGKIKARDMTSEELEKHIAKLNLEKRYKQLQDETDPASQLVKEGSSFVKKFWDEAIKPAAINAGRDILTNYIKDTAKKQLGEKVDAEVDALTKEFSKLDLKQKISNAKKTIYENEKKMNGDDIDESAKLEKAAKDAKNRWTIESYTNKLASENQAAEKSKNSTDVSSSKKETVKETKSEDTSTKETKSEDSSKVTVDSYKDDSNTYKSNIKVNSDYKLSEYTVESAATDGRTAAAKALKQLAKSQQNTTSDTTTQTTKYQSPAAGTSANDSSLFDNARYRNEINEYTGIRTYNELKDKYGSHIMYMSDSNTDELYHHGVKGQKWGVRRYQNKDGSLTDAGKKHRAESGDVETDDASQEITNNFKMDGLRGYSSTIKRDIGEDKNVEITTYATRGQEEKRAKITADFLKKFDTDKLKEEVAKQYYDDDYLRKEWKIDISRDEFKKKIKLTNIDINEDGLYDGWLDDGGTYAGHAFNVLGSIEKPTKNLEISLFG